jgi:D-alanyl-D-alanine carboxypeptidase (penicillin-binding protein 5/6)
MRKTVPLKRPFILRAAPAIRLAFAVLACAFFVLAGIAAAAEMIDRTVVDETAQFRTPKMPTGLDAKSATVIDAGNGRALFSIRPDKQRLIASTTKIMTAVVAISRTRPNEMLTATGYRATPGESILGLKPGERMSAQDLLRALLMQSANDAADTFANGTATSEQAFVSAMNRKARALGLRDTHYGNPVGLDVPRTYSTAHDLAKLTMAAMLIPRFRDTVNKSHATLRTGNTARKIGNRNELVGEFPWVDGVKTGHTTAAGYLLVGAAHKGDGRVISVVTGEPSIAGRNVDTLKLLRFGRGFFRVVKPLNENRALTTLPVALQDKSVSVFPAKSVELAVKDGQKYKVELTAAKELEGPIAAGAKVGTATVTRDSKVMATVPVSIRGAIAAPPITAVMLHELGRLLPLIAILLIALIIGVVFWRRRQGAEQPSMKTEMTTEQRMNARRAVEENSVEEIRQRPARPLPDDLG